MNTPGVKDPGPGLDANRIPKDRYLDPDIANAELDRIFRRAWLYAVPADDVRQPGTWAVFDIGPESILISRTEDGELAANHNTCQHRGRRLMEEPRGRSAAFRCGYHAWTYRLDGGLRSVHRPELFSQDLNRCNLSLRPVQVAEWGGMVWVCLDPDTEPLTEYLGPLPELLSCYHLDTFAISQDQSVMWECNWKVAVDAFHETYHNLGTHPQLMPVAGDVNARIDCYSRHSRFILPSGVPAPSYRRRQRPTAAQISSFSRFDFDASTFEGTADEVLAVFQQHKLGWLRDRGYPVEDIELAQTTENHHYTIFPNTQVSYYPDRLLVTRSRPHPSGDPLRMVFDLQSFVQVPSGGERPDRPPTEHGAGVDFPLVPDFVRQDAVNMVQIQRGLASSGYDGALLSDLELRIRHWHAVYDRAMSV
jgi:phenylpropionate dioxygenase-like ring-hydroxylating dioxygenase large terminal subunit